MSTFNKNPYISGAVSASKLLGTGTTTIYTAPPNSYAILNFYSENSGGGTPTIVLQVGGQRVGEWLLPSDGYGAAGSRAVLNSIYVGPGQAVQVSHSSANANSYISGVQFTNQA